MTYTAEEVRFAAMGIDVDLVEPAGPVAIGRAQAMLTAYAADLDRRAEGVTDESAVDRLSQYLKSQSGYRCLNDVARRDIARDFLAVVNPPAPAEPAQVKRFNKRRFEEAPCYLCGYNGPGYFQPGTHPCAAKYHASTTKPAEPVQPTHEADCNLHMASVKRRMAGCDCSQSHPAQPADSGRVGDAMVEQIIDRVARENSADGMDGDSWDRLLVRAALAAQGQGATCKACGKPWPKYATDPNPHPCTASPAGVPDGDRIDWMEANARSVSFGKGSEQGYWVHVQGVGYSGSNQSLRDAIDSARKAQAAELAAAPSASQESQPNG